MSNRDDLLGVLRGKRGWNDRVAPWMRGLLSDSGFRRYQECGSYLVMMEDALRLNRKLDRGFFCGQRLCSGCAWRYSMRMAQCVTAVTRRMQADGFVPIFITLTVVNVPGDRLREEIKRINACWNDLLKLARYKSFEHHIRKIEVTYNSKTDSYHPHLHALAFVKPSYFKGKGYVSQKRLLEDWRHVTRDPRICEVDICRCYNKSLDGEKLEVSAINTHHGVLEVSKYFCKASDYSYSREVFETFFNALHRLKLISFSKSCLVFKKDWEDGKLLDYESACDIEYVWKVTYVWHKCAEISSDETAIWDYVEYSIRPFDAEKERKEASFQRFLRFAALEYELNQVTRDFSAFLERRRCRGSFDE